MGKFKQYLKEEFYKADNIKNRGYIEVFKNPSRSELNSLYKISFDGGIRIGIDKSNTIYAWIEDALHIDVQKTFKLKFIVRFEYTNGRDTLYLSTGEKEANFKKLPEKVLKKLKQLMPGIRIIEMVSSPFDVVYGWKS